MGSFVPKMHVLGKVQESFPCKSLVLAAAHHSGALGAFPPVPQPPGSTCSPITMPA